MKLQQLFLLQTDGLYSPHKMVEVCPGYKFMYYGNTQIDLELRKFDEQYGRGSPSLKKYSSITHATEFVMYSEMMPCEFAAIARLCLGYDIITDSDFGSVDVSHMV